MPKKSRISFWWYLLLMAREAIEPILLVFGLTFLYSRLQLVSDTMGQSSVWGFLSSLNADAEAHPMLYWIIAIVLVVWILYRSWKLSQEIKRDRELSDALIGLRDALNDIRQEIKEGRSNGNKQDSV